VTFRAEEVPAVPEVILGKESSGENVVALQKNLALVGYLTMRPRFWMCKAGHYERRTQDAVRQFQRDHNVEPLEEGVFCAETRISLMSKVEAVKEELRAEEAEAATEMERDVDVDDAGALQEGEERAVEVTDTDGDTMRFVLRGGRVQEFVNGSLELDEVKDLLMDEATGKVRDAAGSFTVIEEQRARLGSVREMLASVGVEVRALVQRQEQTVEVDIDLSAPPEQRAAAQAKAEEAVKRACAAMGADSSEAMMQLASLFRSAPEYATAMAGEEAGEAVATGLGELASMASEVASEVFAAVGEAAAAAEEDGDEEFVDVAEPVAEEFFDADEGRGDAMEEEEEFSKEAVMMEAAEPVKGKAEVEEQKEEGKTKTAEEEDAAWGKYDEVIVSLMGMGFVQGPTPELIELIEECGGDVTRVVDRLLSGPV